MKKVFCLAMILLCAISISGCSKALNNQGNVLKLTNNKFYAKSFSEDLAWATFDENNTNLWGCYDKSGNIVFKTYDAVGGADAINGFSEGFCYILSGTPNGTGMFDLDLKISVVTKDGNICGTYPYCHPAHKNYKQLSKSNELCIAYGGGCVVMQKPVSNFDSNYYEYTIYDEKRNVITSITYENIPTVRYGGKGVFGFIQNNNTNYYFGSSREWIKIENDAELYFDCDNQILDHSSNSVSIINTQGQTQEINLSDDFDDNIRVAKVQDNKFLVSCGSINYGTFSLGVYDITTNTLKKLNQYLDKLNDEKVLESYYSDNRIILPLIGSDGNKYFAMLDQNWDTIIEPTKVKSYPVIANGRMVLGGDVYDLNGNIVFSVSSNLKNINEIGSQYTDGCLLVTRNENNNTYVDYLDIDGKIAFEIENDLFVDNGAKIISIK